MYPNLRAEMARKNITVSHLAADCGIKPTTLYEKVKGSSKITLDEAILIKTVLGVDMTLEELFEKEGD